MPPSVQIILVRCELQSSDLVQSQTNPPFKTQAAKVTSLAAGIERTIRKSAAGDFFQ